MPTAKAIVVVAIFALKVTQERQLNVGEEVRALASRLLTLINNEGIDISKDWDTYENVMMLFEVAETSEDAELPHIVEKIYEEVETQPDMVQRLEEIEAFVFSFIRPMTGIDALNLENMTETTQHMKDLLEKEGLYSGVIDGVVGDSRSPGASDVRDISAPIRSICYVHAEIDPSIIVNRVTTVEVTVSFKRLVEWLTSNTSQSGKAEVELDERIIFQVIPKTNFEAVDNSRIELDPKVISQSEEVETTLYFDLRATHVGEGEVWVILRQGQAPLLTLTLTPQIVESRALRALSAAMLLDSAASPPPSPFKLMASGLVEEIPKQTHLLHQLRIFEKRNGNQVSYSYELQSPALDIFESYESDVITSDRSRYVENLYKEIESRWHNAQAAMEAFDAELRAFGGQLFDELFPLKLQQRLWNHRHSIKSIMVISTEPFVPWELIHLKQPGENCLPDETLFLGQMGLVRWLHEAGWAPEEIEIRPQRTRYVIPHYPINSGYKLPQAEAEAEFLENRFGATAVEPQPNPVRQLVASGDFDLLHFASTLR